MSFISYKQFQNMNILFFSVNDRFPVFLFVYNLALLYLLVLAFVQMEYKEEKQSPFKTLVVLMIISFVALFVAALLSAFLFYTRKYLQSSRKEAILGCINIYSGFLATLCLVSLKNSTELDIWSLL